MGEIKNVAALEEVVGKKPPALDLKVIDHIDATAQQFLSHARAMIACVGDAIDLAVLVAGGDKGFATPNRSHLVIPRANCDVGPDLKKGASIGSLWLVPGLGETLRINGRIEGVSDTEITVTVTECYLHCAKAFIRSDFWNAVPKSTDFLGKSDFVGAASFMALGTIDLAGNADLSPKGDPSGSLAISVGEAIRFADRPGNRRTDSFRNIIDQPRVCAAFLVPGSSQIMIMRANASLWDDDELFQPFVVAGKLPKLVVALETIDGDILHLPALERAQLWPAGDPPAELKPAKIFTAHMQLSKQKGMSASIARTLVSVPGVMRRGLESDYKKNLY